MMRMYEFMDFQTDRRFAGIEPFKTKVWLSSPTMHGDEQKWVDEALQSNWVSTVGTNINEIEKQTAEIIGRRYAVALSSGTAALHLGIRQAGEKLYGKPKAGFGALEGHKVFASDMTFGATVHPIAYEGGQAIFIDSEYDTWNMDPEALEKAFEKYPDVRLVVWAHLYGTPGKIDEIKAIAHAHHALLVEDAAESFGALYKGMQTGKFGDASILSFNGNKILTGSTGGMYLTDSKEDADQVRKWSTQSREAAPWYQHEEMGYNYRMSNICAGIGRGQMLVLEDHIAHHRHVQALYRELLSDVDGVTLHENPSPHYDSNFWLCTVTLSPTLKVKGHDKAYATAVSGAVGGAAGVTHAAADTHTDCEPNANVEAMRVFLDAAGIESRPLWKPMHRQPVYASNPAYVNGVSESLFKVGLCLPSGPMVSDDDVRYIVDSIKAAIDAD